MFNPIKNLGKKDSRKETEDRDSEISTSTIIEGIISSSKDELSIKLIDLFKEDRKQIEPIADLMSMFHNLAHEFGWSKATCDQFDRMMLMMLIVGKTSSSRNVDSDRNVPMFNNLNPDSVKYVTHGGTAPREYFDSLSEVDRYGIQQIAESAINKRLINYMEESLDKMKAGQTEHGLTIGKAEVYDMVMDACVMVFQANKHSWLASHLEQTFVYLEPED